MSAIGDLIRVVCVVWILIVPSNELFHKSCVLRSRVGEIGRIFLGEGRSLGLGWRVGGSILSLRELVV